MLSRRSKLWLAKHYINTSHQRKRLTILSWMICPMFPAIKDDCFGTIWHPLCNDGAKLTQYGTKRGTLQCCALGIQIFTEVCKRKDPGWWHTDGPVAVSSCWLHHLASVLSGCCRRVASWYALSEGTQRGAHCLCWHRPCTWSSDMTFVNWDPPLHEWDAHPMGK